LEEESNGKYPNAIHIIKGHQASEEAVPFRSILVQQHIDITKTRWIRGMMPPAIVECDWEIRLYMQSINL
jgi:hypothetical protein